MQFKYDRFLGNSEEKSDFWPSFTDMLTTILLVVILVFSTAVGGYYNEIKTLEGTVIATGNELEAAKSQIEGIIGVKGTIIKDLQKEFQDSNMGIRIDMDTGDIEFDSNILFDYGSSNLKPAAKQEIKVFFPKYVEILYQHEEDIEEIIVEGHTDDSGSYLTNLKLSQDRAFNVVSYILSEEFGNFAHKEEIRKVITANGRSYSRPIYKEDGITIDADASRRVVFKFRTKLETQLKEELQEEIKQN